MNKSKILYAGDFPITQQSGRSRATRQKIDALRKNGIVMLPVFPLDKKISRIIHILLSDFIISYYLIKFRPEVFISRGFTGFFTLKLANILHTFTVRELHSVAQEETDLEFANYKKIHVLNWKLKSYYNSIVLHLDKSANMRIFNHVALKNWFVEKHFHNDNDIAVYNGFCKTAISSLSMDEARLLLNLKTNRKYLTFVGSVAKWHGTQKLLQLSQELAGIDPDIYVIIGGGRLAFDEKFYRHVKNITPLDSENAAHLIRASNACLLTVEDSRTSPGSPLKLYDYIGHDKLIISQEETKGYSDEVVLYGKAVLVDFDQPYDAAQAIVSALKHYDSVALNVERAERFTWHARTNTWLHQIQRARIKMGWKL